MVARGTLTETRARELIGEVLKRTSGETVAFFKAEGWLRGKEVSKWEGTHTKYAHNRRELRDTPWRARLNITAISTKDVAGYRDAEIASGKHPNTVCYLVKQLRIPFNAARRQGILTHNPAEAVELPATAKGEDGGETKRDAFTVEQVEALLDAAIAREHGKPVFETGADGTGRFSLPTSSARGCRTWRTSLGIQSTCPRKWITYCAKKGGKLVTVPIHPDLETYLLALPAPDSGKAFGFPALAGGRSGLSTTFALAGGRRGQSLARAESGQQRSHHALAPFIASATASIPPWQTRTSRRKSA